MKKTTKHLFPSQKKDFSTLNKFPGDVGNPFDTLLRNLNKINQINSYFYFSFLVILSAIGSFLNIRNGIILLSFSLLDWILVHNLKRFQISYGESKSQVLLLIILRIPFIWILFPFNLFIQILGSLLVIYGFYYEPSTINITKTTFISKKIKINSPFRLIQIGDLHLERFGKREKKVLNELSRLKPDLIVYTGDFLNLSFNSDPLAISQIINFLDCLQNISTTFYVSGSPAVDLEHTIALIEKHTTATRINNEISEVEINSQIINIIGLTCSHNPSKDRCILENMDTNPEILNLLLYHSPDLIFEISEEKTIDLMLSGHTHGGQVRLPIIGALFTGSLYGRLLQNGLYQFLNTSLYISKGIGFEGMGAPRVRFLCKPEIVEWTIMNN
jgi:hypothetical protein